MILRSFSLLVVFFLSFSWVNAQEFRRLGRDEISILISSDSLNFNLISKNWTGEKSIEEIPNLGIIEGKVFVRLSIDNSFSSENIFLRINYPIIDTIKLYELSNNRLELKSIKFEAQLDQKGLDKLSKYIFPLKIPLNDQKDYLLELSSNEQIILPISLHNRESIVEAIIYQSLYNGVYIGIILIMMIYNLFVFASVGSRSYLYYVLYILFLGLTQLGIKGQVHELFHFITPGSYNTDLITYGCLGALFGIVFTRNLLNTDRLFPKMDKIMIMLSVVFCFSILMSYFISEKLAFIIMQINTTITALVIFTISIFSLRKGVRQARFFVLAWSFLLIGALIFLLKDAGVLPYNAVTNYTMQAASSIEMALLSFALADKINVLTTEKEESRLRELNALKENEQLTREQNVILESKVRERTKELLEANLELESVLYNLKNAQTQLVSQEKMASLGQLTAGIAHEINNPINFVSSNINPLRRDIKDLLEVIEKYRSIVSADEFKAKRKEVEVFLEEIDFGYVIKEIDQLVNGIQEGADRTAEIVKGLKNFSRLDEVESKSANLHEGIDSTLLIILSGSKVKVEIVKDYDENIREIECFPGKLNQVFSNILSNGFQAMENNLPENPPSMKITTKQMKEHVSLSFKDNGPGIPAKTIEKIYEPFFTTKEVGEGTGLGLSIVFSIIESHKGKIEVNSEPPNGTEFLITLPKSIN